MSAFQRKESHPGKATFPLAPLAPVSTVAAAGRGGVWGKGAPPGRGRGATPANCTDLVRDPQAAPSGYPCSADSGSGRLASFKHDVHCAAARAGSDWQGSCVRRSAPVKERAGRLPIPGGRLRSGSSPAREGPAPSFAYHPPTHLICIAPARSSPARLNSRLPAGLVRPAHLLCISLLVVQRVPSRRGRDAQLTNFGPLGADAENCSRAR